MDDATSDDPAAGSPEADELYGLPAEDFVAARDRLVATLKRGGDAERAAAVKKLRRPTKLAWALNQVARADPAAIGQLVESAGEVRRQQEHVLGGGESDELRRATRHHRQLVDALAADVANLIGGERRTDAIAALDGALAAPDLAEQLRVGRLATDPAPPAGFQFGDVDAPPPRGRDRGPSDREVREHERAVADAEQRLARARDEADRAATRAAEAVEAADAARAAADRAQGERDEVVSALERLRRR